MLLRLFTCDNQSILHTGSPSKLLSLLTFTGLSFPHHSCEDGFLSWLLYSHVFFSQFYSSFQFSLCKVSLTWTSWKFGFPSSKAFWPCKYKIEHCSSYFVLIRYNPFEKNIWLEIWVGLTSFLAHKGLLFLQLWYLGFNYENFQLFTLFKFYIPLETKIVNVFMQNCS